MNEASTPNLFLLINREFNINRTLKIRELANQKIKKLKNYNKNIY